MDLINNLYVCNDCNFNTCKKSNYKRHLNTKKHIINKKKQNNTFLCEFCERKLNSRSSLWRHSKTCKKSLLNNNMDNKNMNNINYDNKFLINNNQKYITYNKSYINICNININNVNIFLNNECKNAISIQDFMNNLNYNNIMNINNINNFIHKNNYNNYLIKLFTDNIKLLSMTERPIHCKNNKIIINNKDWYIKDKNDGWKEENGIRILNTIKFGIQKECIKNFENNFPNWNNNENLQNTYLELISIITSETTDINKNKILNKISKFVLLHFN